MYWSLTFAVVCSLLYGVCRRCGLLFVVCRCTLVADVACCCLVCSLLMFVVGVCRVFCVSCWLLSVIGVVVVVCCWCAFFCCCVLVLFDVACRCVLCAAVSSSRIDD